MPLLQANGQVFQNHGADASVSEGTQVTSAGTNHTKGSYVQLVAATTYTYGGFLLVLGGANTSSRGWLFDLAVGGAGSEQVIVPNLYYYSQADSTFMHAYFPIMIPQGTRISARSQSTTTSNYVRANVIGLAGEGLARDAVTYGADTANTTGTTVTASGSTNTKGSWAQIVSATTRRHKYMIVCTRASGGSQYLFDIGIGGSGSETVLIPNLNVRDSSGGWPAMYAFPCDIPSGTRIASRCAAATGGVAMSTTITMI